MDMVKWHSNERVNIGDFRRGTGLLALYDHFRQARTLVLPAGRTTGQANTGARILKGFDYSVPGGLGTGTTMVVEDGWGIFPYEDTDGTIHHGLILGEQTPASYTIDFGSSGTGTYSVFVRAIHSDADTANRVFWNAATPAEEIDSVATTQALVWEYVVQDSALAPPGDEYVKIYEVTIAAGPVVNAVADFRHYFFEGSAHTTDDYGFEWGDGANDRNSDRASYGINDLHMWVQAVRRQLADIIGDPAGAHEWQKQPACELKSLNLEHYSESESATYAGAHKQVRVGNTATGFWVFVGSDTAISLTALDALADMTLLLNEVDATEHEFIIAPRGLSTDMANGDDLRLAFGDSADRAYNLLINKSGADQFTLTHKINGNAFLTSNAGSAWSQESHDFGGVVKAEDGYRMSSATQVISQQIPLQWMVDNFTSGWTIEGGGYGSVPSGDVYLYNNSLSQGMAVFIVKLPHNAVLNQIAVLWEQSADATAKDVRLYAQRFRQAYTDLGWCGGGSGAPTNFTSLKTANDYVEYPGISGGASPYRRIDYFTCDVSTANRTFNSSTDTLVITIEGHDAGTVVSKIYFLTINYDLDYVTPPPI
jgi:hypothetical protein